MTAQPGTGPHSAWTRANGERPPAHARVRDSMDTRDYHGETARKKSMPGPVQTVECSVCHEKTIARSADAPTLAGWTVGEWPAEPQEFGRVSGKCRKCAAQSAAAARSRVAEVTA